MNVHDQRGVLNVLLIPVIILSLAVAGLGGFGVWAYSHYQDYKNNVNEKIATAVADARIEQQQELAAEFAEREKKPNRQFTSPEQLGSISFEYPKTWSAYVDDDGESGTYEAFLHPGVIPPVDSDNPDALRLTISSETYEKILDDFESNLEDGELRASPIKLKAGEGTRLDGKFDDNFEGSMIVFPLRDKTVQLFTESNTYLNDFNNTILPTLQFIP